MGDMFRFYVTDGDGKVTDKTKLYSPLVKNYKDFSDRPYQQMDKEYNAELREYDPSEYNPAKGKKDPEVFSTTILNGKGLRQKNPSRLGFSGIGKADSDYSLYSMDDTIGRFSHTYDVNNEGNLQIRPPTEIDKHIFDDMKVLSDFYDGLSPFVSNYIDDYVKGSGKFITPEAMEEYRTYFRSMPMDVVNTLLDGEIINSNFMNDKFGGSKYTGKSVYTPTMFTSEGDRDELYNLLNMHEALNTVDMYLKDKNEMPVLTLTHVPENKLVSTEDIGKYNLNSQRDYPEELVAKTIVPYRVLDKSFMSDLNNLWKSDLMDSYLRTLNRYRVSDDVGMLSNVHDDLMDEYNNLFKKHGIVSDNILSDETKKNIFRDMSNDYNKMKTQKNVNRTLKDISTF